MAASKTFEEYQALATEQVRRFADAPLLHFIDGRHAASVSGETFDNHSPVDSMLLGTVASGDAADIDAASKGEIKRRIKSGDISSAVAVSARIIIGDTRKG